jgi:perosamine synthetase
MRKRFIPVAEPALPGNVQKYVLDCIESTWISSAGQYVDRFEAAFAEFCGVRHAMSCCNGTAALHLALLALGVGPGDEVIVPTLTYVATANAVTYCGATSVFVDSEVETWNMDPALIEAAITPRTRGIVVVHLYGHPVDMDPVLTLAKRHGLFVVEDAAEAHGAEYRGKRAGSLADIATFSFYGNKIITTGEGGMVTTADGDLARSVRQLKGQGMDPERRYWFPIVGYNYRMTNIAAAIGLAQMENAAWHLERRLAIAASYRERLRDVSGISWQREQPWAKHAWWMFTILLDEGAPVGRDQLMADLYERGIETRPVFYPIHSLPPYADPSRSEDFPVADGIAARGLNLPTSATLTEDDIEYVCGALQACLDSSARQPA